MTVLFDIDFEAGDLSEFTTTVTDGGDLSVTQAAALASTGYGLQCVIDDTTAIVGRCTLSSPYSTTGILRFRFYVDPNTLTMANGNSFALSTASGAGGALVYVFMTMSGTQYQLAARTYNDASTGQSLTFNITDDVHYIECLLTRATDATSNDGTWYAWVDGGGEQSITNIDNYDKFSNFQQMNLGAAEGIDAGTNGTFFVDQLIIKNDGTLIGPVAAGGPVVPVFMNQYRQRRN